MAPVAAALMIGIAGQRHAGDGPLVLRAFPPHSCSGATRCRPRPGQKVVGTREAIRPALRHPSYLMLARDYLVSAFTWLPGTHCPRDCLVRPADAVGGLVARQIACSHLGSVAMGWAVGRWR